jgi:hypothetical protein
MRVLEGQVVARGEQIGWAGNTGCGAAPDDGTEENWKVNNRLHVNYAVDDPALAEPGCGPRSWSIPTVSSPRPTATATSLRRSGMPARGSPASGSYQTGQSVTVSVTSYGLHATLLPGSLSLASTSRKARK